jgi:membrane protein
MMFAYFRAPVAWTEIFKRTAGEIVDDNCLGLAAQLAFYFLLALFPALIFMVAVLGYLPVDHAMDALLDALAAFPPADVLAILRRQVRDVAGGGHMGLLTISCTTSLRTRTPNGCG